MVHHSFRHHTVWLYCNEVKGLEFVLTDNDHLLQLFKISSSPFLAIFPAIWLIFITIQYHMIIPARLLIFIITSGFLDSTSSTKAFSPTTSGCSILRTIQGWVTNLLWNPEQVHQPFFLQRFEYKFSMFRSKLSLFKQIFSCFNSQCSDVQMLNSECSDVQPASRLAAGHLVSRLALARREQSPGYYRGHCCQHHRRHHLFIIL